MDTPRKPNVSGEYVYTNVFKLGRQVLVLFGYSKVKQVY